MKLYIPKDREAENILVVGATGSGKSSTLRNFTNQAIERGWPCIFTDIKGEYTAQYYRPSIDHIINFADTRCSVLRMEREAGNLMEAGQIAYGLYPDMPNDIPFFKQNVRDAISHMIGNMRLPCQEIGKLSKDPNEMEKAFAGTEYETFLTAGGDIRAGFIGNIRMACSVFGLMPTTGHDFCVREWCEQGRDRKGHIFLSSSPTDRKTQKHLQAMIIEMLFKGMQKHKGPGMFVLDEIGVLGKVPGLEDALSVQRSSGNPIILGFQGFSQLAENYGENGKRTIVTNPTTQLMGRMKDPEELKYASQVLGMPSELERLRETKSAHWWKRDNHHSYSTERPMISAVSPGEIQKLKPGQMFLSIDGEITKVKTRFCPYVENQPKYVPREWPTWVPPAPKPPKPPKEEVEKAPQKAKGAREYPKEKVSA
jgi:hypothetical protein